MKFFVKDLRKHETKRKTLIRFMIGFLVLIFYSEYLVSIYGSSGIALGAITWSALVLATPIADGGLLLDFPIRLITGMRMIFSEIIVWVIAISLNVYFLMFDPKIYDKTLITHSLYQIFINPWPNWIIIIISAMGTFISIYFGDELLDVVFHKERKKYQRHRVWHRLLVGLFFIFIFYFIYRNFLHLFGIEI